MLLGISSRSNDVVEPMIKPQWYVSCDEIGQQALDAVMDEKYKLIEIIPKQYSADWKRWLEKIRDWCISRQLWWGHRIPAYYVTLDEDKLKEFGTYNDHWVVARNEEEAKEEACKRFEGKKFHLGQDPEVLDTWFSSGLFPLSVLGWPEDTEDLRAFYPTSVLETGHDILFFWVARMVMQGTKLGGDVPFRKSDKINLDILRVIDYRRWCNKLWNAIRFAMGKLGDNYIPDGNFSLDVLPFSCQWILSVLNKAISKTVTSLESYEFSAAGGAVYAWWFQLCDVFIEVIKPYFAGDNPKFLPERNFARYTLWLCLDNGLRMLHPFMPFITEELWQRLPFPKDYVRPESIMISQYPSVVECWTNESVEQEMKLVESTIKSVRSLAREKRERLPASVQSRTDSVTKIITSHQLEIVTLTNLSSLTIINENDPPPSGYVVAVVDDNLSIYMDLLGSVTTDACKAKED